jgi:hypothetical protein
MRWSQDHQTIRAKLGKIVVSGIGSASYLFIKIRSETENNDLQRDDHDTRDAVSMRCIKCTEIIKVSRPTGKCSYSMYSQAMRVATYLEQANTLLVAGSTGNKENDGPWQPCQPEWSGIEPIKQNHLVVVSLCVVVQSCAIEERFIDVPSSYRPRRLLPVAKRVLICLRMQLSSILRVFKHFQETQRT